MSNSSPSSDLIGFSCGSKACIGPALAGAGLSDNVHRPGPPGSRSRVPDDDDAVKLEAPRIDHKGVDNTERPQRPTAASHASNVAASSSTAASRSTGTPLPPQGNTALAFHGPQSVSRPMGPPPSTADPPAPPRSSAFPRSATLPPPRQPEPPSQQLPPAAQRQSDLHRHQHHHLHLVPPQQPPPQQTPQSPPAPPQQQQLWEEQLPPHTQTGNRQYLQHLGLQDMSTGPQQQQQPAQSPEMPLELRASRRTGSPGDALGRSREGREDVGMTSSTTTGGGGGGGAGLAGPGCDDQLAWEPLLARCESLLASPLLMQPGGGQALFPTGAATAAPGDSSPDQPYFASKARHNSQVLLPPLLMRVLTGPLQDGSETPTVFFGPGALPGLLSGSSPPESGAGTAGARTLAGPMFLHVAPTAATRHQMTGMVPTLVACMPNDDDSTSLWEGGGGGGSVADPGPSILSLNDNINNSQVPSGAAGLASYIRSSGQGGNAAAAAAAAATLDLQDHRVAVTAGDATQQHKHQQGGSWMIMSNAFGKPGVGFDEHGSKAPALSSHLSAPPNLSDGRASAGTVAAARDQAAAQPAEWQVLDGTSNVSLATLRPFNTAAQVVAGSDLDYTSTTAPVELAAAHQAAATAVRSCGGGAAGGSGRTLHGSAAPDDLAAMSGGWLMTQDGSGTSRRYGRAGGSAQGARAVAAVCASVSVTRERNSGSRAGGAMEAAAAAAAATALDNWQLAGPPHGGGGSGGAAAAAATAISNGAPSRAVSLQRQKHQSLLHHCKKSAVRPLSADGLCVKGVSPAAAGGRGGGTCHGVYGSSEDWCSGESPILRWQRAARAAGVTAAIARSFRTLRNQHDENMVREEQLQVVGEIGAGSFARVDKCLYKPPDGGKPFLVAVKRIKPEMLLTSHDPEDLQLFVQEAQLLRKLNHPHVVKYIGLGIVAEGASGDGSGGGSGGGGVHKPHLDAEALMELSRRSCQAAKRWRAAAGAAGGRVPSRRQLEKLRSKGRSKAAAAAKANGGGGGGNQEEEEDEEQASPPSSLPLLRGVFIVEEFLGGGTLKGAVYQQMLKPQRQLYSNATALRWMAQVAGALSYMHTCRPKVLHRDIKLDNVLLQPAANGSEGSVAAIYEGCIAKLGDLGLAALLAHHRRHSGIGASDLEVEEGPEPQRPPNARGFRSQASVAVRQRVSAAAQSAPHLRQANDAARLSKMLESHKRDRLGTYMYMAPEVYQRQKYDEKCDCFSFAMLLYEVLHRFITACSLENTNQMEKYAQQVSLGFRPTIHEDLPAPLRRIIKQCWAQDPNQRPDMAAVASELCGMEARGVVAQLDRKQQRAAGLLGACCCIVS